MYKKLQELIKKFNETTENQDDIFTATLLCTLFDHVCETRRVDKNMCLAMIAEVNNEMGNMYH